VRCRSIRHAYGGANLSRIRRASAVAARSSSTRRRSPRPTRQFSDPEFKAALDHYLEWREQYPFEPPEAYVPPRQPAPDVQPILSAYSDDDRLCFGLIFRGREGFELRDPDQNVLETFETQEEAVAALLERAER